MPEALVPPETIAAAVPDLAEVLAAAQDRAQYNRSLIEACPDPLIVVGGDGRITDANLAFFRVTGFPREKIIGSEFAGHFTDRELARASHREALSGGILTGYPLAVRNASGHLIHLQWSAARYRNGRDQAAGLLLIAHDVSQQKQREEELARLHADMAVHMEELKQREREIQRINDLYEVLQACNSRQEAYPIIGSVAAELFPKSSGALAVSISLAHQMETAAEWGAEPTMAASFLLDDCWALRRGQMQEVAEPGALQTCRHFQTAPSGPYICLPLTVRGDLLGLLNLRSAPGEFPGPPSRQLLTTLGEVIKLSLSSLKLRDALRAQAIRDPLTGLFNRNYLDETLRRELSRSARHQTRLCVAMLDIDDFKVFNDTYSHHAGDVLLKALAEFFMNTLRASDVVCRYGGDEFVLVLPDTDLRQVSERLDRMRREVRSMECRYDGRILPAASVSIGVAQWPEHGTSKDPITSEELIQAADRALYSAKHGGRDQVCVLAAAIQDQTPVSDSTGGQSG
jgi:diguanylate cyclase (GGDEF)-like protein/PAS domain S-box-containing protein